MGVLVAMGLIGPKLGLDHASASPGAPGEGIPPDDHDHGADDGGDDRAHVERTVDRVGVEQHAGEEAADERAHDAEHDVPDDTHALVTTDEEASQVAGDRAEHDPCNDAHGEASIPTAVNRPVGRSPLSPPDVPRPTTSGRWAVAIV